MFVITCQNSYGFRAIWSWQISSFVLYFLEILEITEILEILEIQAQIYLNVNRMTQSVIGAIPPGGFGGAGAPQSVDPLLSWLGRRRRVGRQKVASIWLKIGQRVV